MMTTHAKPPKIALASKPSLIKLAQDIDFFELFKRIEAKYATCFYWNRWAKKAISHVIMPSALTLR